MGIKKEFGKKIKRMRINRGLTQDQLAEMVDVSQRTLSAIEIGENFVTSETFDKLVKALNTTSDELFSTNHLKSHEVLLKEIMKDIPIIAQNPEKFDVLYNVIKALKKE